MNTFQWSKGWIILSVLLVGVILFRLLLPTMLLHFVNRSLSRIPDYFTRIEEIDVHLWRGAYEIRNLKMTKKQGEATRPFLEIESVDLSMEWKALFYGRMVGEIVLKNPRLTFINSPSTKNSQFSFTKEWREQGEKLFPFEINRLVIEGGRVEYRDEHAKPAILLNVEDLHLVALNLQNVQNQSKTPLPASISATAKVFETGTWVIQAKADLVKTEEDFFIQTQIKDVDLKKLNSFFDHYGNFNFSDGKFSVFSEVTAKEGRFEGYLKPFLENVRILDGKKTYNEPLRAIWETIVAGIFELFKNHSTNQFATRIPLSGSLKDPDYGLLATIGNVLKNAFIQAFEPRLDPKKPGEK